MIVYDENVREALATLADAEWQRRVWTGRGNRPDEMDSFEECVERLYTDTGLGDALDKGERVFTSEIDGSLVALDRLLRTIEGGQVLDTLIESQLMQDVRQLAGDILSDLEAIPTTPTRETVRAEQRRDEHA